MTIYSGSDEINFTPNFNSYDVQPITQYGSMQIFSGALGASPFGSTDSIFFSTDESFMPPDWSGLGVRGELPGLGYEGTFGSYQGLPLLEVRIKGKLQIGFQSQTASGVSFGLKSDLADRVNLKLGPIDATLGAQSEGRGITSILTGLAVTAFPGVKIKIGSIGQVSELSIGPQAFHGFVTDDARFGFETGVSGLSAKAEFEVSHGRGVDYFSMNLLDAFLQLGRAHLPAGM